MVATPSTPTLGGRGQPGRVSKFQVSHFCMTSEVPAHRKEARGLEGPAKKVKASQFAPGL